MPTAPSGRFGTVKIALLYLCIGLTPAFAQTAGSSVRITDDRGGNIGQYWARYMAVRDAGQQVIIDGACDSACTLVLGIVPSSRICITPHAVLGFHAAYQHGFLGFKTTNAPATRTLWNFYPPPIRQWIARNGGLGDNMLYLSGLELAAMYRQCH
ncbi:MAG TPA: hypothetical protein VH206_19420 [Xanthobacteraceae bacterium]|jgi:hypothetical protein|nr:hypothetical protein [Xanthobacteraceae bacterium]